MLKPSEERYLGRLTTKEYHELMRNPKYGVPRKHRYHPEYNDLKRMAPADYWELIKDATWLTSDIYLSLKEPLAPDTADEE